VTDIIPRRKQSATGVEIVLHCYKLKKIILCLSGFAILALYSWIYNPKNCNLKSQFNSTQMAFKYSVKDPNDIYFITSSIIQWIDVFTRPVYQEVIIDALNYCSKAKGLHIHAWCLMTNHIHLLASVEHERPSLPDSMRDFKKFTSKKIIETLSSIVSPWRTMRYMFPHIHPMR
jgi:REP element-mobilizing transposase RayT